MAKIKTPCIGICSTVFGDIVCRGCKRYSHEIIAWNGYSDREKTAVIKRLEHLSAQVIADKIDVFDEQRLQANLKQYKVRYDSDLSALCCAYELLKKAAGEIKDMEACGLSVKAPFDKMSLPDLKDAMDHEFYLLTEAHYQRYFEVEKSGT